MRAGWLAPRDWSEEDQAVDEIGRALGEPAGDDCAPGMRDEGDPATTLPRRDEAQCLLELPARLLGAPERRHAFGGMRHFWIRIGEPAEAVEVERPDIESGGTELVAPGPPVKRMRDGEGRGKCPAMDVENGFAERWRLVARR